MKHSVVRPRLWGRGGALAALAVPLVACAAMPDLVFFDDDGGAPALLDGGTSPPAVTLDGDGGGVEPGRDAAVAAAGHDAGAGSSVDSGKAPGHDAGPVAPGPVPGPVPGIDSGKEPSREAGLTGPGPVPGIDSGGAEGCPLRIPPGADACCGPVPCVGKKCELRCGECGSCLGEVCCVPNGEGQSVTCASSCGGKGG